MKKNVIVVIVEGESERIALSKSLSDLLKNDKVNVIVADGDITSKKNVKSNNIISHINNLVKEEIEKNFYKKSDVSKIIQIIDMDGAFIPCSYIVFDKNYKDPFYTLNEIKTNNVDGIKQRNLQKSQNIRKLLQTKEIGKIPYECYYMSCNLDHVMYDLQNCASNLKVKKAKEFAIHCENSNDFLNFIKNSDFSVVNGYKESWLFIQQSLNSLNRFTNLALCFEDR